MSTSEYRIVLDSQVKNLSRLYKERFGYIDDGVFAEIGSFNCQNWSNTIMLVEAGWRGLYVEPQPNMMSECRQYHKGNDNLAFEQVCVSDYEGFATMTLGGSLSTINDRRLEDYSNIPWSKSSGLADGRVIECPVTTLDSLLLKHDFPRGFDLLSIDVEGSEHSVLRAFDVDYWLPTMVIIEAYEKSHFPALSAGAEFINEYFESRGYEKIYSDHINNIYYHGA